MASYASGRYQRISASACATGITASGPTAWSGCFPAQDADIRARLFNADGSEAEISGNGTRCVAAYLCSEANSSERATLQDRPETFSAFSTGAGIKSCALISHSRVQYEFEIAMGEPGVGDELPLKLAFGEVRGIPVSMGNPHYVVFVRGISLRTGRPRRPKSDAIVTSKMGLMLSL